MKFSFTQKEIDFFAENLKKEVIAKTFYKLECAHISRILNVDNKTVLESFFNHVTEGKDFNGKISRATKDMYSELKLAVKDKKKQKKIKDKYKKKIKDLKEKAKEYKKSKKDDKKKDKKKKKK